jgi:methionyl-tRNA formyltransferase
MRIIIITQNEPFYLAENLNYLIKSLPKHSEIVACVVNDASPFGKKESFFQKAKKTFKIFGFRFFVFYAIKFVLSKLNKTKKIDYVLENFNIPKIKLKKNINHKDSVSLINNFKPDLLISILGNQIFKEQIFNLAPKG